jgi:UDP-N-acetylmuramoyl-tripeptide--D-alanyl-D-alanine ligase
MLIENLYFYILSLFWFIRETKAILFWLYLWQLKEYHIGRFVDHFRTEKGKRIFLNYFQFIKIFLILGFFFFPLVFPSILIFLYFAESVIFFKNLFQKRLLKPILTKKITFLILSGLFFEFFFIFIFWQKSLPNFALLLLLFDILTPALTSGIVLIFQPLAVFKRNQIIKKAKEKRAKFKNLIVIGITGSYGKTSTKEFLATILSERFKVLKTKEHQNSEIGISQCILNDLKEEHEIFIVEMGAYNRGGIKLLCDIVKPQIGILTGINEQHMATFGSQDNIVKTKYELIESLPEMGFAVFNGDSKYCRQLYKKAPVSKRICYTTFSALAEEVVQGDFWTSNIKLEKESLYFKVFSRWGDIAEFKLNLLGEHYAQNILMAAIIAKEVLGMSLEEIAQVAQKIKPEQGGMRLIKTKYGLNIIDATYSANPDGVISHLEYLKVWPGKKIIIMPCLIELGSASKEVHKRIGQKIGEICDLAIITTRERFQDILEGAMEKGMPSGNILFIENPKEIFKKIKSFCQSGDVILLESRVPSELKNLLWKLEK